MGSKILRRYRDVRTIAKRHFEAALDRLSRSAIVEYAKLLDLAEGRKIYAESDEEFTLIFDLALHVAKPRRPCALERYAKTASLTPGSEEARVLAAMRQARFSIWRIEGYHQSEGLIIEDLLSGGETWLIDQSLTRCMKPGMMFATRLFCPAEFAVTCGLVVPIDEAMFAAAMIECPSLLLHDSVSRLADDPRLAIAIYRAAIWSGVLQKVRYEDPDFRSVNGAGPKRLSNERRKRVASPPLVAS